MANDAKSLRNFAVRKTAIVGNFSSKLIFGHNNPYKKTAKFGQDTNVTI